MKKIICLMMTIVLLAAVFCSCGNMSMGLGNYEFAHIHFADYAGNSGCATVEKWYDNSTGVEVKTAEYGPMYFSEGTYVLIESAAQCPFCGE